MKWLSLVALMLLAPLTCDAEFRTLDVESLRITIDTDWAPAGSPGYQPVRFDITNLGDPRAFDVVGMGTRFLSGKGGSSWATTRVVRSLRMARGDRVRFTIPIPVFASNGNYRFEIQEDGRTLQLMSYSNFVGAARANLSAVLVVGDHSTPLGAAAPALLRPFAVMPAARFGPGTGRTMPMMYFTLETARLPANWLGYTSLRAVVIGPEEWLALEDAQRDALLTWTACGGDLVIASSKPIPLTGGGHHVLDAAPDGAPRTYFFGRIHRRPVEAIVSAGLAKLVSDTERLRDADLALPLNRAASWNAVDAHGFHLAIPGVNGVPTRAYLSILILFSILIGPVNYVLLWRRRRLVMFVLTAPLISALFIVLLAGYVVAGEGFHVSGRAATLTMLDQASKQAVTRTGASLYAAGMTPSGGLKFGRDIAVYALGPDGDGVRDAENLDLTERQQFSSGFIRARAATNFEEIAFRPARERLTFERGAAGVRVVNGLGATVQKLVYRSGGTSYGLEGPLAEGASAILKPGAADARAWMPTDPALVPRFVGLLESQPEGSYFALLERSPFWEPGIDRVVERGSFHLVFGLPDGQR